MIKLRLKRKMSGRAIRKSKRQEELSHGYNSADYSRNRVKSQKRRDNPNILSDDKPLSCAIRNIRIPKKGRKTAWKRFHKAFPYVKVTKKGKILYCPEKDKL